MRFDERMVGRTLQRVVEGDLEIVGARRGDEAFEIGDRSERRLDRRVAAGIVADRPRAARIRRQRVERVVAPLTKCVADRMDRREIHDVESHVANRGEASLRIRKRSVLAVNRAGRAWEEFVPCRELRGASLDEHA
jgi:hypothetical protein